MKKDNVLTFFVHMLGLILVLINQNVEKICEKETGVPIINYNNFTPIIHV